MLQLITWAADNFIAGKLLEKKVLNKQTEFSAKLREAELKTFLAEKRKEAIKQSEAKAINEKEEAITNLQLSIKSRMKETTKRTEAQESLKKVQVELKDAQELLRLALEDTESQPSKPPKRKMSPVVSDDETADPEDAVNVSAATSPPASKVQKFKAADKATADAGCKEDGKALANKSPEASKQKRQAAEAAKATMEADTNDDDDDDDDDDEEYKPTAKKRKDDESSEKKVNATATVKKEELSDDLELLFASKVDATASGTTEVEETATPAGKALASKNSISVEGQAVGPSIRTMKKFVLVRTQTHANACFYFSTPPSLSCLRACVCICLSLSLLPSLSHFLSV